MVLEANDEMVVDGEKNQCMGARKHQAGVDSGFSYFGHVVREERRMENDVMLFWCFY